MLPLLAAAVLGASACQTQTQTQTQTQNQTRPIPQEASSKTNWVKLVDDMVARCHGPVRGSMDNAYLELWKDGSEHTDKALLGGTKAKPHYLRITHPDRSTSILSDKHAGRYLRGRDGHYTQVKLSAGEKKDLADLHALLRTSLLRPLYEAERVRRQGPNVYQLILKGGETWRLEVDPKTGLPQSLTGPRGEVTFHEHKATGVSFMPKVVTLGRLGKHHVNLITSGLVFNKPYFEDPETPLVQFKDSSRVAAPGAEPRTPTLEQLPGRISLVLPDPGDWEERIDAMGPHLRELYDQGQTGADLMFFFQSKGEHLMAIPFEPDSDRGSQPFLRRKHQNVLRRPPQLVVAIVVRGSEKNATAAGSKAVDRFLGQQKLHPTGPLRVIPYVAPEKGAPTAKELQSLKIRLELPVARLEKNEKK